jgi:type IV secretion system protein VirD4
MSRPVWRIVSTQASSGTICVPSPPRYISQAIGDRTYLSRTKSWRQSGFEPASISEHQDGAALIRPEQIRLLGPNAAIALVRDLSPAAIRKVRYYEDRQLRRIFEAQARESFDGFEPTEMPPSPRTGEIWEAARQRPESREPGAPADPDEATRAEIAPPPTETSSASRVIRLVSAPASDAHPAQGGGEISARERRERLDMVLGGQDQLGAEIDDLCASVRQALLGPASDCALANDS